MRRNKRAITHMMYLSSSCNGNALLLILLKLNTLLTKFFLHFIHIHSDTVRCKFLEDL